MIKKISKCVYIPLKDGEKVKRFLKDNNLLRKDLKINKDNKYIYFQIINRFKNIRTKYNIKNKIFEKKSKKSIYYKEKLEKLIPKNIFNTLPNSFDIARERRPRSRPPPCARAPAIPRAGITRATSPNRARPKESSAPRAIKRANVRRTRAEIPHPPLPALHPSTKYPAANAPPPQTPSAPTCHLNIL